MARKYAIGVVLRNRRKPVCNARVLTPATVIRSASAIASRACSSTNCSTRRTKNGAVDSLTASIARCLLLGIEVKRSATSPDATRSATSGFDKSDASLIVANHPHVKCESADIRNVIDGHFEFDTPTNITAGPGANFALHQSPIDAHQKLACSRRPLLSEGPTRIYNRDRPLS